MAKPREGSGWGGSPPADEPSLVQDSDRRFDRLTFRVICHDCRSAYGLANPHVRALLGRCGRRSMNFLTVARPELLSRDGLPTDPRGLGPTRPRHKGREK